MYINCHSLQTWTRNIQSHIPKQAWPLRFSDARLVHQLLQLFPSATPLRRSEDVRSPRRLHWGSGTLCCHNIQYQQGQGVVAAGVNVPKLWQPNWMALLYQMDPNGKYMGDLKARLQPTFIKLPCWTCLSNMGHGLAFITMVAPKIQWFITMSCQHGHMIAIWRLKPDTAVVAIGRSWDHGSSAETFVARWVSCVCVCPGYRRL